MTVDTARTAPSHRPTALLEPALSPLQAVAFLALQQGLFGVYMGSSFAPNHKGMPVLGEGEKVDFLRRQVLTSRNVRGGWITDFALGGLNYQIEHHLFPSMPRPSLRHARAPVRAFCAERGIPYYETGLFASYAEVLRHLHTVGLVRRNSTTDKAHRRFGGVQTRVTGLAESPWPPTGGQEGAY